MTNMNSQRAEKHASERSAEVIGLQIPGASEALSRLVSFSRAIAAERVPQMQEREMRARLLLDFAVNEAKAKDPKQRDIQRPRAFYRREMEAHPFIVAKP